jgi:OTU domain-containing protein 6
MAGSKRNKIKKAFSPTKTVESPPPPITEDNDLMDDLFAQLESKDKIAQETSAEILKDASLDSVADSLEQEGKKDSKARFKARQVRLLLVVEHCHIQYSRLRLQCRLG